MEIVKKYSIQDTEFVVLKSFCARPAEELKSRTLKPDERVRFDPNKTSPSDVIGWAKLGRIAAANLPNPGIYRAKKDFSFRIGGRQMVDVKRGEIIEMMAADAWPMLLTNSIVPGDEHTWTPERVMPSQNKKKGSIR